MPLTLEDIQTLSTEVKHLVDAGLPLESSLANPGKGEQFNVVAQSIAADMASGRTLEQVVAGTHGTPKMLAAAIGAGIRSGNLALAVELMGDFAADLVEQRNRLLQAAAYPLIVVTIASLLTTGIMQHVMEQLLFLMQDWQLTINPWLFRLLNWNAAYPWWTLVIPIGLMSIVLIWILSGRANAMAFRGPEKLLLLMPGVAALVRDLRYYTLSRMLSLLTERGVQLSESLVLAGGASGSESLERACRQMAGKLSSGTSIERPTSDSPVKQAGLPSLLHVCLAQTQRSEERLVQRLRSVASFYRTRLERNATWIRLLLPTVLFVVIGGGTVLLYCCMVFWPMAEIYQNLGQ